MQGLLSRVAPALAVFICTVAQIPAKATPDQGSTANVAAAVTVSARQDGAAPPVMWRDGGPVTLPVDIGDRNAKDTHTIVWTAPPLAAVTVSDGVLTLAPASLPAGFYRFTVAVTDSGSPSLTTQGTIDVVLSDSPPALPSGAAGWAMNALPAHPAYTPPARNVLPERSQELDHFLIETDPGLELALGSHTRQQGLFQSEVSTSAMHALPVDRAVNVGGFFDFAIAGLPEAGQTVNVVIPQRAPIPADAIYRKLDSFTGRWTSFFEDHRNRLASAPGTPGFCPSPSSQEFRAGLNAGDWCVRLSLSDGGPNDADHAVNGAILDPGGVASSRSVIVTTPANGGGANDVALLFLCGAMIYLRRRLRLPHALVALLIVLGTPVLATAGDAARWYPGFLQ